MITENAQSQERGIDNTHKHFKIGTKTIYIYINSTKQKYIYTRKRKDGENIQISVKINREGQNIQKEKKAVRNSIIQPEESDRYLCWPLTLHFKIPVDET